jgi:hypothetical protein
MSIKASEAGGWLRQYAGKRDHREVLSGDYLVLRPDPNFHGLMGDPAPAESPPLAPGQDPIGDDHREAGDRAKRLP